MGLLSFLGLGKSRVIEAIDKGGVIIDVRPAFAFDQQGRIPDAINIPLDRLPINIERLRTMKRTIIICSEYMEDAEKATRMLREKGMTVLNAGNWQSLYRRLY